MVLSSPACNPTLSNSLATAWGYPSAASCTHCNQSLMKALPCCSAATTNHLEPPSWVEPSVPKSVKPSPLHATPHHAAPAHRRPEVPEWPWFEGRPWPHRRARI